MDLNNKTVLITGGTGSFGRRFVDVVVRDYQLQKLIIFSRDELKQSEMREIYPGPPLRYFIGDVRDRDRLERAMRDVDVVIHAAALKQVPACEYNPMEAVKTNVMGAQNVIDAAIDTGVKKVLAISTDKAVNPINLYGATKLCSEKLFVQGNAYAGRDGTLFACARYGNVVGSRGSVLPLFKNQRSSGTITITDKRMTRFWLTLDEGVRFILQCIENMRGGEVFVPKIPSMRIMDLAEAVAPECEVSYVGIRPGEKLHEVLISSDEARSAVDEGEFFVIQPPHPWFRHDWKESNLPEGFEYTSDNNDRWLSVKELREMSVETHS